MEIASSIDLRDCSSHSIKVRTPRTVSIYNAGPWNRIKLSFPIQKSFHEQNILMSRFHSNFLSHDADLAFILFQPREEIVIFH